MAQTHFGYQSVEEAEKARRVRGVFDSVASRYDVMNDVLSLGMHRVWKAYTVGVAAIQPGMRVLDIAGGTGDLARAFAARVGEQGCVVLTDIQAVGHYAVQPSFTDGHESGIFTWGYLYHLGSSQADLWQRYEQRLAEAGMNRDAPMHKAASGGGCH